MKKKALLTGGLGFIGSHLAELLLDNGYEIVIIDNKSTHVVDEDHFEELGCEVITASIQEADLSKIKDVSVVFHLASILGPVGVLAHSGDMGFQTISDVVKMRDYCIENGCLMVDISTSEVYGHTDILSEDSPKIISGEYKVRTEYGAGKLLSEISIVNKAKLDERLKYHIIRPFNVTGRRQKPDGGFVLPRFAIAALTGQPITVYGDGSQRRAFTHVDDIVEAIYDISHSEHVNDIWNIGNPDNEMSIKEMAELVVKVIKDKFPDKECKIEYVDPKKIHGDYFEEAIDKIPYIKKINSKLGWSGKRGAEKIFSDVVDYYSKKVDDGYHFDVMSKWK